VLVPILLVLLAEGPPLDGRQASIPVPPGLSWADADRLAQKLDELEAVWRRGKSPRRRTVQVTAAELNSYLNLTLHPKLPAGVSDLAVQIDADRITARAMIDLEQVRPRNRSGEAIDALALLSGRVPLELRGRFRNEEPGFGSFDLQEVRLGGWPLPVAVLAERVAAATRKPDRPEGVDIASPFRLPLGIRSIRLQPGVAHLEQ
jgi:hypothetical protein